MGEPDQMISMKNSVYVELVGDPAGARLLRLNNVEWRRGEKLRMQMIPARMDSIVQYVSVELKLNSKNEAHIKDRHGHGNRDRREGRNYREIQDAPASVGGDPSPRSADGKTLSGGEYMGAYPCHDTCRGTLSDAPPPLPPPLRVMVARPAQATHVTQVPNPLLHEPLHGVPCHRPPPPPPCHGGTRDIGDTRDATQHKTCHVWKWTHVFIKNDLGKPCRNANPTGDVAAATGCKSPKTRIMNVGHNPKSK